MKGHKLQERTVYSILENGTLERDFNRHIIHSSQETQPLTQTKVKTVGGVLRDEKSDMCDQDTAKIVKKGETVESAGSEYQ